MSNLKAPLTEPGEWVFEHTSTGSKAKVKAQFWFKARREAAQILGVPEEECKVIKCPI